MNSPLGLDRCLSFINCQLQAPKTPAFTPGTTPLRNVVTISRQAGSGAHEVAEQLAEYLQAKAPNGACPWTVFDRNLVDKVLNEHHMPARLARFLREDRVSELNDTMDELFGLHPPSWLLVRQASETILHLAELGNVILIGRGAAVITSRLENAFHVRLVGSLERRAQHLQEAHRVSRKEALDLIRKEDGGRERYMKKYFGRDIADPLLYHLVINTDVISYAEAAHVIGDAVTQGRTAAVPVEE